MNWFFNFITNIFTGFVGGELVNTIDEAMRDNLSDDFLDAALEVQQMTGILEMFDGNLTVNQWELLMRETIHDVYISQYLLGIGGIDGMTPADWGSLGGMLRQQYRHLAGFSEDLRSGNLTLAQAQARANLYIESSTQAYERAKIRAAGFPDLPQVPGDGNTQCLANCRCHWKLEETETEFMATWVLDSAAEHCDDCPNNAARWNPLVISK